MEGHQGILRYRLAWEVEKTPQKVTENQLCSVATKFLTEHVQELPEVDNDLKEPLVFTIEHQNRMWD